MMIIIIATNALFGAQNKSNAVLRGGGLLVCVEDSSTERFTNLGKLNFPMRFDFRLKLIFNTTPAASKNTARLKSGQNWLKMIILFR